VRVEEAADEAWVVQEEAADEVRVEEAADEAWVVQDEARVVQA